MILEIDFNSLENIIMSSWKLVEAVAEETPAKANADQQGGRGTHSC